MRSFASVARWAKQIEHTAKAISAGVASLRFRVLLLVLLALAPAFAMLLYTTMERRGYEAAQAQADALSLVRLASAQQERLIEGARELLVGLAQLPAVRRGDTIACDDLLFALREKSPRYANLGAVRPNGKIFCSATPVRGPINVRDRAFFQRAVQTRSFAIGDYQIDPSSGHAILTFAYPVLNRAGQMAALIFADLDLTWISSVAAEAHLPHGSVVTLVDQNGTILARDPDPKRWVGKSASAVPIFQAMVKLSREGTAQGFELDGIRSLFAFKPLLRSTTSGNIYVVVGIPTAVAFARSNRLLAISLAGLLLVAALAITAVWVGSDVFLLRQVRALVGATDRLRKGDLSARTGLLYGPGELSRLARTFDEMAAALQTRQAEAERAAETMRKLWSAVEQTADSVIITNRDGIIEYVNPAFERETGYRRDEVIGRTPSILKSDQHGKQFYEHLWEAIVAGEVFRAAFINRKKDGTIYYEDKTIAPLRDSEGTITHFVSTGRDISDLQRAGQALRHLNEAMEQESRRIAHALHDEAGQLLAAVDIALEECARELPPTAQEQLQEVRGLLDQIEAQLRHLSHELRPTILDDLGLVPAMEFLAEGVSARTGLSVTVDGPTTGRLPLAIETALYRIVQEALTNVTKHAQATSVSVQVKRENRRLRCTIHDDGIGFDVSAVLAQKGDRGLGLVGIRERLNAVGGRLQITSAPGQGTELAITIPLEV
ncbi:MAG: PAS domain S-box protein [Candidatus Methylomirabilis oxyfera]|nr:PAS domain S-box protein [Candidatus Methylomirabilis oxyfera]